MKQSDWIGIAVSLAVHVLLLLVMARVHVGKAEPPPLGFVEVEFGPYVEGRRSTQARQPVPEAPPEPAADESPAPPPAVSTPEATRPVDLPEPEVTPPAQDVIPEPEEEVVAEQPAESVEEQDPEEEEEVRPLGSGNPVGEVSEDSGDRGEGNQEQATAPYQIEGLNRSPVSTPPPRYPEQVNADIRVRITVDPSGRVTQRIPLIKGNARLEQAVMEALATWRFNPLPPDVPQEAQSGVVTFRFRLR